MKIVVVTLIAVMVCAGFVMAQDRETQLIQEYKNLVVQKVELEERLEILDRDIQQVMGRVKEARFAKQEKAKRLAREKAEIEKKSKEN